MRRGGNRRMVGVENEENCTCDWKGCRRIRKNVSRKMSLGKPVVGLGEIVMGVK